MPNSRLRLEIAGAAHLVLPEGVSHLDHEESIFRGMLRGWNVQQQSRQLSDDTIKPRERYVTRLHEFTGQYPWEWGPASLEDFSAVEFRSKQRAKSTIRGMQNAIGLFCEYITDVRYDWVAICQEAFGRVPVQICTEMNTLRHGDDYEGDAERRPFTRNEQQTFFDYIDDRYNVVRRLKRKGSLALLRDSTMFKTILGWGLRRNEASRLATQDRRRNPAIPEYGIYGALHVRYGKAVRGGAPRRREVLSMPHFEWAIGALRYYCEEVRPLFQPGNHPALFISERLTYLNVDWIDQRFVEFRKGAGLPEDLDLHCLRHTYSTFLAEERVDPLLIQNQMGHEWASTTGIYTHVSRDFKLRTLREAYDNLYRPLHDKETDG
jgi:integrase/recombinase XerC